MAIGRSWIGRRLGPMSLMRRPEPSVGPPPASGMLRKWRKHWLRVRSASTVPNCWPVSPESIGMVIEGYDISQLRRLVAHHKRLTRKRESKTGNGYLHFGHSDELVTTYWGELPGLDARMMEKAVDQKADEIIPADQKLAVAERRALALAAICQDSLYQNRSSESAPTDLAVIVDAGLRPSPTENRGQCSGRAQGGTRRPRRDPV